ncbi:MAG: cytochrome b/b6 domain-containing protein, partial [Gallionellaceae bacterium]|nr:cytochrome b/b6 domain-containing protein [Gallionellaceae bacterium]
GELGGNLMDWHGRAGLLILGLLVFRVIWGFVGTPYARFLSFFPTPSRLRGYFAGSWRGYGHTPLGALSVIALLLLLAALVGTGLFANDDIAFYGPLSDLVSKHTSDRLAGWHARLFNVLAALVILHIAAVVFYAWVKKRDLVTAMLTGKKKIPAEAAAEVQAAPAFKVMALRFMAALLFSGLAAWGVGGGIAGHHSAPSAQTPAAAKPDW